MESMVEAGAFREDLFWRLNVLALHVPSLYERKTDIPILIDYFLKQHSAEQGLPYTLSDEARNLMMTYSWPGNVRELQNALKCAVVYAEDGLILPCHLPQHIVNDRNIHHEEDSNMPLQNAEKQVINQALSSCGGNLSQAARMLGISRVTLYKKIKQYCLVR
jgi:DNA-binding NtrC family response regulator